MPAYDAERFVPPAPLAKVGLRRADTGAAITDVHMLIDSGADITLVPNDAIERLGAKTAAGKCYELVGFDGTKKHGTFGRT